MFFWIFLDTLVYVYGVFFSDLLLDIQDSFHPLLFEVVRLDWPMG